MTEIDPIVNRDPIARHRVADALCIDLEGLALWHLFELHPLLEATVSVDECPDHNWADLIVRYANLTAEMRSRDTLPEWLYHRFRAWNRTEPPKPWQELHETDREYWQHEADAIRRAVARNGFKHQSPSGAFEHGFGQTRIITDVKVREISLTSEPNAFGQTAHRIEADE